MRRFENFWLGFPGEEEEAGALPNRYNPDIQPRGGPEYVYPDAYLQTSYALGNRQLLNAAIEGANRGLVRSIHFNFQALPNGFNSLIGHLQPHVNWEMVLPSDVVYPLQSLTLRRNLLSMSYFSSIDPVTYDNRYQGSDLEYFIGLYQDRQVNHEVLILRVHSYRIDMVDINRQHYQPLRTLYERNRRVGDNNGIRDRRRSVAHRRAYRRRHGAFFPYRHVFGEEGFKQWHTYQLYGCNKISAEKCLYVAIKETKKVSDKDMEHLKHFFCNSHFPKKDLGMIAEQIKKNIEIKDVTLSIDYEKDTKRSRTATYPANKKYSDTIKIGYVDGHFFCNELVESGLDITAFAIKHYESLKHVDNWQTISCVCKGKKGPRYKRDKLKTLKEPYQLFKHLLLHKKTVLTPILQSKETLDSFCREELKNNMSFLTNEYDQNVSTVPYGVPKSMLDEALENGERTDAVHLQNEKKQRMKQKTFKRMLFAFDLECCMQDILPGSGDNTDSCGEEDKEETIMINSEEALIKKRHVPFIACFQRIPIESELELLEEEEIKKNKKEHEIKSFVGVDCVTRMISEIYRIWYKETQDEENENRHLFKKGVSLIAHNATYDSKFVFKMFNNPKQNIKLIESNGMLKQMIGGFIYDPNQTKEFPPLSIQIRDSYAFIATKLSQMPTMFKLNKNVQKEILPYDLYTYKNVYNEKSRMRRAMNIREFAKAVRERKDADLVKLKYAVQNGNLQQYTESDIRAACHAEVQEAMMTAYKWDCLIYSGVDTANEWEHPETGEMFWGIDHVEYCLQYCKMDVKVLSQSYLRFRKMVLIATENLIDIDNCVSISQVANEYLFLKGVYDGCYQLSSTPDAIIRQAVVGGRVMGAYNKKHVVGSAADPVSDFDAVSLYPTAMSQMPGYLKGIPKQIPINTKQLHTQENWDGYFAYIRITSIKKKRPFPSIGVKNKNGTRLFTNEAVGKVVFIDRFALENMIAAHGVTYEVVDPHLGYYFNEGRNDTIKSVIRHLFTQRKKFKKEKNPVQAVFKLLMNSAYGRTLLRAPKVDIKFVRKDRQKRFEQDNWSYVKSYVAVKNNEIFTKRYEVMRPFSLHYSAPHIGSEILSYSKKIMDRVVNLADDIGIKTFYQDTDSFFLQYKKLPALEKEFFKKYGTRLVGNDLGQFHPDFEWDDFGHLRRDPGRELVSTKLIVLGKKAYLNVLIPVMDEKGYEECKDCENVHGANAGRKIEEREEENETMISYHVRMKGVPSLAIFDKAVKDRQTVEELYMRMYNGEKLPFNVVAGTRVSIRTLKSNNVITEADQEMIRNVQFTSTTAATDAEEEKVDLIKTCNKKKRHLRDIFIISVKKLKKM